MSFCSEEAAKDALALLKEGEIYEFPQDGCHDEEPRWVSVPRNFDILAFPIDRRNALLATSVVLENGTEDEGKRTISLVEVSWPPTHQAFFIISFYGFKKDPDPSVWKKIRNTLLATMVLGSLRYNKTCKSMNEFLGKHITGALQLEIHTNIELGKGPSLSESTREFLFGGEGIDTSKKRTKREPEETTLYDSAQKEGEDDESTLFKRPSIRQCLGSTLKECSVAGKFVNFLLGVSAESIIRDLEVCESES